MSGMSLRNGTWSSQSFQSDLADIQRLARKIEKGDGDPLRHAKKIRSLAAGIARDLPTELG